MRVETSIAHSPNTAQVLDRRRPERQRPSGDRTSALGATTALESLCGKLVGASCRAERLPAREELDEVRRAAQKLARQAVSLRDAQRAVHEAVSAGLKGSVDGARGSNVVDSAVFMMRVLELLGNAVSSAYIDQCQLDSGSAGRRVTQLVELLTADDADARMVGERHGIDIAAAYDVVVVHFVGEVDSNALAAAETALTAHSAGSRPLTALNKHGGTILVPCDAAGEVDDIVVRLSAKTGVDIVAATAKAAPGAMADAVAHCRELVELARSLGKEPRLYRTCDLALEYQLSRPGPGRSRLRSVIAPLATFPELLHTLRTFIANEANRRVSAKTLFVHPNTVDYRLKRVEHLTGVDPLSSAGLMSLHAALVVDCLARANGAGSALPAAVAEAS